MRASILALSLPVIMALLTVTALAQEDAKGSKDHPLFTRMPDYTIGSYETNDFNAYSSFRDSKGDWITVEGRYYKIDYVVKDGAKPQSGAAVLRNHINAIKRVGGEALFQDEQNTYMKLEKDGKRAWAYVYATGGEWYSLVVVEEEAMEQVVVADAKFMASAIGETGRIALYGIYFDFNKAEVKPESEPALKEIAGLLKQNPKLKLYVVGHTDNVGDFAHNMKLSQARAEAVVQALVTKHGADTGRLKAQGAGPLAPLASNQTEEGRAKNRRVELVEQ